MRLVVKKDKGDAPSMGQIPDASKSVSLSSERTHKPAYEVVTLGWKARLSDNWAFTVFIFIVICVGLGLLLFKIINGRPIDLIRLIEAFAIFLGVVGALWASIGVFLAKDELDHMDEMLAGTDVKPAHLQMIAGMFKNASVYAFQGMILVSIGGAIVLLLFIFHS